MTPDLDQNLSLKASLEDKVSPALQKIKQGVRSTRDALNELVQSATTTEGGVSRAAEGMASKTANATDRLQGDLKKTGGAFESLSKEASTSSQEIGKAVQESLYGRESQQKLKELDKELGGLKSSLEGMASTARPISTRSKKLQAIGRDTLNKQVIPAFQELHATLDQYPNVLEEISMLENRRMENMGRFGDSISGVNDRVSGFGEKIKEFALGMEDLAAGIATGVLFLQGLKLRDLQTEAGRVGGIGAFSSTEHAALDINTATEAPVDVWKEAYLTLLDISRESKSTFPYMLKKMVELEKVTGIAAETFASLRVRMVEIGNVKANAWEDLTKKIHTFATSSRASIEEMTVSIQDAADSMLMFSRDARRSYAESMMASAAASKNLGLDANAAKTAWEAAHTFTGRAQAIGLLAKGGVKEDVTQLLSGGEVGKFTEAIFKAAGRVAQSERRRTGTENLAMEEIAGPLQAQFGELGFTPQDWAKLAEADKNGQLGDVVARAIAAAGDTGDFDAALQAIRGTFKETSEKFGATAETLGMQIGKQQVMAVEKAMNAGLPYAQQSAGYLLDLDRASKEHFSKSAGFFLLAQNLLSGLSSVVGLIPFGIGEKLQGVLSGPLEKLAGGAAIAYGIHRLTGGDSIFGGGDGESAGGVVGTVVPAAAKILGASEETQAKIGHAINTFDTFNREQNQKVEQQQAIQTVMGERPAELDTLGRFLFPKAAEEKRDAAIAAYDEKAAMLSHLTAPQIETYSQIGEQKSQFQEAAKSWGESPDMAVRQNYQRTLSGFDEAQKQLEILSAQNAVENAPMRAATPGEKLQGIYADQKVQLSDKIVNTAALNTGASNAEDLIAAASKQTALSTDELVAIGRQALTYMGEKRNPQPARGSATDPESDRAMQ